MKEFYTIGEMSHLFKISTDTLRYYDKIDLIKPWITGDNNYRYYSKAQFEMMSTILLLRSLGTPIDQLQTILRSDDASLLQSELKKNCKLIDQKIKDLSFIKEQALLLDCTIDDTCYNDAVTLRRLPPMYALIKEYDSEHDELDIDEIRKVNHSAISDWVSYASIISTIDQTLLNKKEFHRYKTYGYLSETPCDIDQDDIKKTFDPGWYVCCNAKVTTIDHWEIDRSYLAMLDFIAKNHYTICGDAIERNVLDFYRGTNNDLTIYFKLYIPVQINELSIAPNIN